MSPSATDPFRWWHEEGWRAPVIADVLYRREEWVATFFAHLGAELTGSRLARVRLETQRDALVVTGMAGPATLRMARATYLDVVLFHRHLHPDVEAKVNAAVVVAATECARRGFAKGEDIRRGGRDLLLADPAVILHSDVVDGLRHLDLSGLPPVGVSGVVEVRSTDGSYIVASMRSDRVAVNPGCLGPSVDGGLGLTASRVDPKAGLRSEIKDELPWQIEDDDWALVGTLLPPTARTLVGRRPTRRCGVNVVYRASIGRELEDVFLSAPDHFEAEELMLISTSREGSSAHLPPVLAFRHGQLVEVVDVPPLSEVLVSALARRGLVEGSIDRTRRALPPHPKRSTIEARVMSTKSSPVKELTLEDAWAENLIERHTRLNRVLDTEGLSDLEETEKLPTLETLGPVFDTVREFEFVRGSDRIKAADDARLFEALVYRVGRYLFANNEKRALAAHDLMLPRAKDAFLEDGEDPNPIGTAYTRRLEEVIEHDVGEDPKGVWRDEVETALQALNRNEAVQEYAEVGRRGRLLCFCAALWSMEVKRSPHAATVALDDSYRKSLSGDVIALFFRARALLVSPVISAAQAQLGLQFVTTALATYHRNPGMHHTKAIFLLRQSALTEIDSVSLACLDQALDSIETALEWDAEFPKFYATRAKVKYRLKDRPGALIDVRAAIELARYSDVSPVVQAEIAQWEALLETWQLSPVTGAGD